MPAPGTEEESELISLLRSLTGYAQTALQYGLVPFIVYLGVTNADPPPSLLSIVMPLL